MQLSLWAKYEKRIFFIFLSAYTIFVVTKAQYNHEIISN